MTGTPKTKRRMTTPEQRARIVSLYKLGNPIRDCAAAVGVAYSTAHAAIVAAEVPRRKRGSGKVSD